MSRAELPAGADPALQAHWESVDCGFAPVAAVFAECHALARRQLTDPQFGAYLDTARWLGKLGRGAEPMLAFLEQWPEVAASLGAEGANGTNGAKDFDALLPELLDCLQAMQKSPNSGAIAPLLQTLAAVARRLQSVAQTVAYLGIVRDLMQRTTTAIHGRHATHPSPGLPGFLASAPELCACLAIDGIRNWVDYGVRNFSAHPEQQRAYFSLQSADSRAILQRERHGTLFADVARRLDLALRALWDVDEPLHPLGGTPLETQLPYADENGLQLPDRLDERAGVKGARGISGVSTVSGIDRYHAIIAHLAGHRRWSRPLIADNWSPAQRLAVECFEDGRIDTLAMRRYPGLRRIFLALHPHPRAEACDDSAYSCIRHRLAMLSRALLDPAHGYHDAALMDSVRRFHAALSNDEADSARMAELALAFVARTRRQNDQRPQVWFDDMVVDYRDDNRLLWRYIEDGDEEDDGAAQRQSADSGPPRTLPPRRYPEWDYHSASYRPDWNSVYETQQASGDARLIDALLKRHAALGKRLRRLVDLLKPPDKVRLRYQEEGSELDLDVAIGALVDLHTGRSPETRINVSHRRSGRRIAVLLLLDLSASLNEPVAGGCQTILDLAREAVALLASVVDALGDPLAIAGFHSNTRHEVRYTHIKGYSERWDDTVKARLAALEAGYSTRIGAALRHAAHYLGTRDAERKLLLIVTDGEPADIDSSDPRALLEDARMAVRELAGQDIHTHCISLDAGADDYVRRIFDRHYTVIDRIERLPERLPQIFLGLTK